MFEKLKQKRQTFSYTRLEGDEEELRPLVLRVSESFAFSKVSQYVKDKKLIDKREDKIHHEIFIKDKECETTFLFTSDEDLHTILSVTTYSLEKGITYSRLLQTLSELKELLKPFLIQNK